MTIQDKITVLRKYIERKQKSLQAEYNVVYGDKHSVLNTPEIDMLNIMIDIIEELNERII
jgi:hypothetical protein